MRILYDGLQISSTVTGAGHYTDRLLKELLAQDRDHEWLVLCHAGNQHLVSQMLREHPRAQAVVLSQQAPSHYRAQQELLAKIIPVHRVGLFVSPSFLSTPPALCPSVSAVLDATYALYPEVYGGNVAEYLHECVADTCRNARRIITLSENSRQDLVQLYRIPEQRVAVVPLAANPEFHLPQNSRRIHQLRTRHGLPERYVLAVNMGNPKKNAPALFRAYARLPAEVRAHRRLALVGSWHRGLLDLEAEARQAGIGDEVVLTGYVPQEDLPAIYAGAEVFCFPSLHEGFGLPILEAMASGVPVVCSTSSSCPEVAGAAAAMVDPMDDAGMAEAIMGMLADEAARASWIERGRRRAAMFSWAATGRATLAVISQAERMAAWTTTAPPSPITCGFAPIHVDELACAIVVEGVRPEAGSGGGEDDFRHIARLHTEFGCTSTVFVSADWEGYLPLRRHREWVERLAHQPGLEIACHGPMPGIGPGTDDPGEFRGILPEQMGDALDQALSEFTLTGLRPVGCMTGRDALRPATVLAFDQRFSYVVDTGNVEDGWIPQRLAGGHLIRFPVHQTIDALGPWPERGLVLLRSCLTATDGRTDGWSEAAYERVRSFLHTGQRLGARFISLGSYAAELRKEVTPVQDVRLVVSAPKPFSLADIDPITHPNTGTMIDRYAFASHWCKDRRVIDAGCGSGYGSMILLALGANSVVGIDKDRDAVVFAQERFAGPRMTFHEFDLASGQPWQGDRADTVVSIGAMEHLPRESCATYLRTLQAMAVSGGTILIATLRRTEAAWRPRGGSHCYEYSIDEFRMVLMEAFPSALVSFQGIEEFRIAQEERLYSRWSATLGERTRIMVGIITGGGMSSDGRDQKREVS